MSFAIVIVSICGAGIAAIFGYLVFLAVRYAKGRFKGKKREFEYDEDTLTVSLGGKRRK